MFEEIVTDVLVVGSGAAGLCAAIAARQGNAETLVASISSPGAGNSTAVAGGIINAAIGADDSPEIHFEDTLRAGAFLNDRPLVLSLVEKAPKLIPQLEEYGVVFIKEDGQHSLARSPGHTRARTLLFSPKLGTTLSKPLAETARMLGAKLLPNFNMVKVLTRNGRAVGAIGYQWESDRFMHISSKVIILATGGASLLYDRTRIPPAVPGDGYGIALDAGLTLQDMEFVQFYPTVMAEPGKAKVLIGYDHFLRAGAVFRNALGEDIVARYDLPEPEMITRDQLATAIAREISEGRSVEGAILMDVSGCQTGVDSILYSQFPFVTMTTKGKSDWKAVLSRPVRVAPANHYYMGGVKASANGETSIEGLLACGEVVGGTHGANRLQANSLSETVVAGSMAGITAARVASRLPVARSSESQKEIGDVVSRNRDALNRKAGMPVGEIIKTLQMAMTANAALIRDAQGLQAAKTSIVQLRGEVSRAVAVAPKERAQLCTISRLLDTAECVVLSALARQESRGAHFRMDYPERDDSGWMQHVTCSKIGESIVTSTCEVTLGS